MVWLYTDSQSFYSPGWTESESSAEVVYTLKSIPVSVNIGPPDSEC